LKEFKDWKEFKEFRFELPNPEFKNFNFALPTPEFKEFRFALPNQPAKPGQPVQPKLPAVPAQPKPPVVVKPPVVTPKTPAVPATPSSAGKLEKLIDELIAAKKTDAQILEALTLATASRLPTATEKQLTLALVAKSADKKAAWLEVAKVLAGQSKSSEDTPTRVRTRVVEPPPAK
jgi:hypothetical protein